MLQTKPDHPLLTENEVAELLSVSVAWLQKCRWRREGGPPHVKIGRAVRYEPAALRCWIEANRVGAQP